MTTNRASARYSNIALYALCALFTLITIAPTAQAQISQQQTRQLLEQSGIWVQLSHVARQMKSGFQEQIANADKNANSADGAKEKRDQIASTIDTIYHPERLRQQAQPWWAQRFAPQNVEPAMAWLDSDLGKKITWLEVQTSDSEGSTQQIITEGTAIYRSSSESRQQLIRRVAFLTRDAEATVDGIINTSLGVMQGYAALNPQLAAPMLREKAKELQQQRNEMIRRYQMVSFGILANVYATLTDQELQKYSEYLASTAGKAMTDTAIALMNHLMRDAAEALGKLLLANRQSA